ncbi:MAG: hypothetical protein AABX83_01005 [Nanoarchaeota archaeon]
MANKISCRECSMYFQDGEVVRLSYDFNGAYHHRMREYEEDSNPMSCIERSALNWKKIIFLGEQGVYYKNNIYPLFVVSKIAGKTEIGITYNKDRSGHLLLGNLEGLIEESAPFELDIKE